MDKNEFDIDFDFEEEYGFDPKDLLAEEDDFNFSDFLDEDLDGAKEESPEASYSFDESVPADVEATQKFSELASEDTAAEQYSEETAEEDNDPVDDDTRIFRGETLTDEEEPAEEEIPDDISDEEETDEKPKKKKGLKLPKLSARSGKKKSADPDKKSVFSKLLDIYMEPVTRMNNEPEAMDPLDPRYNRRKAKQKKRIFKEVYLPAIIAGVALFLILSFIVGSISNAVKVNKNKNTAAKQEAQVQANAAGQAEVEYKRLVAEAESLAITYDYDTAIQLLENYRGNDSFAQQINAKKAELLAEKDKLLEWKDVSGIPNLSFHVLMADASRACNKDIAGDLAPSYNKNFVSVEEFGRILNQLYAGNYVLVDFNSFISSTTGVDGNESFFTKSMYLPKGKRPVMITETLVNYFEYMVDPDKDGKPDSTGHGFANKLVLDANGNIKAAYVDSNGQSQIGNYDLVPVLEAFIEEHPDFSYRGARATLAVTGSEGVFGYRTNTSYVQRFGQTFYDDEVAEAKKVVEALRNKGYTIACNTYSNQEYRKMNTLQIQAEMQNWTNQIAPVLGDVNTIVFARNSDIEAYSGTTFNVLYNAGIRFFLNSGSSPRVDANTTFVRQTRLMVTGENMAWYSSQFSEYFDCNVVMDLSARGTTPVKS